MDINTVEIEIDQISDSESEIELVDDSDLSVESDSNVPYNKYQNGKIYKIVSINSDRYYIGSTYLPLNIRLNKHKTAYKRFLNGKIKDYCKSFDMLRLGDYSIILLELYPCNNKKELRAREGEYIRLYRDSIVNKNIPGRTNQEYSQQYYLDNKTDINTKRRTKIECECGGKYTVCNKARHEKTKKHQDYVKINQTINLPSELKGLPIELNLTIQYTDI